MSASRCFFDLPAVIFVISDGQVHNLTTVTCLENPAKAGTRIDPRGRGRPWRENLQKPRLECWGQIERRWFLVVLWEIDTKDFLPVQLFRAPVRPDPAR